MWSVARFLLAVFIGSVTAALLPRPIGGETRLFVRWDLRPTVHTEATFEPSVEGGVGPVAVETSTALALVDPTTGRLIASVPRDESSAVSERAYISQPSSAANWTIRSWNGEVIMTVPNVGVPRIEGDVLLQFESDGAITAHHLSRRWRRTMDPVNDPTVYGVISSDAAAFIGRGTLRGDVEIVSIVDGRAWRRRFDFAHFSGAVPTVYGLHLAPVFEHADRDTASLAAEIVVLRGLNPQTISVGAIGVREEELFHLHHDVPDDMAVRWPTGIVTLDDGRTVVGLSGGFAVAHRSTGEVFFSPVPRAAGVDGVSTATDGAALISFPYRRGTILAVGGVDLQRLYPVALPGFRTRAAVDGLGAFVLEREDLLLAVEVRR